MKKSVFGFQFSLFGWSDRHEVIQSLTFRVVRVFRGSSPQEELVR